MLGLQDFPVQCFNVFDTCVFRIARSAYVGQCRFRQGGDSFFLDAECGQFLQSLVNDCIEANGLECEGSMTDEGCVIIVTAADPTQTNEVQRQAVKSWLEARSDIELKSFSELHDAWYTLG